jgi:hypothetical protein
MPTILNDPLFQPGFTLHQVVETGYLRGNGDLGPHGVVEPALLLGPDDQPWDMLQRFLVTELVTENDVGEPETLAYYRGALERLAVIEREVTSVIEHVHEAFRRKFPNAV